jgi:hypothetical protein
MYGPIRVISIAGMLATLFGCRAAAPGQDPDEYRPAPDME